MKNNDRNEPSGHLSSWRDFFKTTGQVVAASALTGGMIPYVHSTKNNSNDDSPVERSDAATILQPDVCYAGGITELRII